MFPTIFLLAIFLQLCLALPQSNTTITDRAVSANYVFTAFTDASESNLYVYTSPDTTTWTLLKGPTYTPPTGLIRDPSVMLHTDGKYYITCKFSLPHDGI